MYSNLNKSLWKGKENQRSDMEMGLETKSEK